MSRYTPAIYVYFKSTLIIDSTRNLPGVSVSWGATGYTVSESQSVVELKLVISGSTSYNSTLLISTLAGSATGACDYEKLCSLIVATHNAIVKTSKKGPYNGHLVLLASEASIPSRFNIYICLCGGSVGHCTYRKVLYT